MLSLVFLKPNGNEVIVECHEQNVGIIVEKCWKRYWKLSTINGGKNSTKTKQEEKDHGNSR